MLGELSRLELILRAVRRARTAIFSLAAIYGLSVTAGIFMVHLGSRTALDYRDRLVARAYRKDGASILFQRKHRITAAFRDACGNLALGAAPSTITGLTVVSPYLFAAYRGWVGGIVSVDGHHKSRLGAWRGGAYYLTTLILQLIPYSLAGGIGIHLGLSYFRNSLYYPGKKIGGYPVQAILDVVRVYCLVAPLSLIASLWEFLCPWN